MSNQYKCPTLQEFRNNLKNNRYTLIDDLNEAVPGEIILAHRMQSGLAQEVKCFEIVHNSGYEIKFFYIYNNGDCGENQRIFNNEHIYEGYTYYRINKNSEWSDKSEWLDSSRHYLKEITDFNRYLKRLEGIFNNASTRRIQNIEEIKSDNATPYSNKKYNTIFTKLSARENKSRMYISELEETRNIIDSVLNAINKELTFSTEVKQLVNKQQFRSGLTGLSKQEVMKHLSSEEINQLPENVHSIVTEPYRDINNNLNKKGGKIIKKGKVKKTRKMRILY